MRRNMLDHCLAMAALGAAACLWGIVPSSGAPNRAMAIKFVAVEKKASNSMVAIAQGATLVLRLTANLTTGYGWHITANDAARLRPVPAPGTARNARPARDMPGAGDYQQFWFEPCGDGETTLTLSYTRPFEQNAAPARTYSLKVKIGTFGVLAHQLIIVTDADQIGAIGIDKGTLLTVSLPSNPTTGYNWQVGSGDARRLPSISDPVYIPPSSALPGAGGYQEFLFEAKSAGDATLVLNYKRPFEPKARPARTFRVTASIRG